MIMSEYYPYRCIQEVIFFGRSQYSSVFKEHLIYDENCEFLQGCSTLESSTQFIQRTARYIQQIVSGKLCLSKVSEELISHYKLHLRGFRPTYYNLEIKYVILL